MPCSIALWIFDRIHSIFGSALDSYLCVANHCDIHHEPLTRLCCGPDMDHVFRRVDYPRAKFQQPKKKRRQTPKPNIRFHQVAKKVSFHKFTPVHQAMENVHRTMSLPLKFQVQNNITAYLDKATPATSDFWGKVPVKVKMENYLWEAFQHWSPKPKLTFSQCSGAQNAKRIVRSFPLDPIKQSQRDWLKQLTDRISSR